jgi:hypothetical protein
MPIVLIAVALVIALIGIVGVAFGAADKPSKVASTKSTTTTEFSGDGGDAGGASDQTTLTTLPGATTTTVKGAPVTTSKPGATTSTTTLDGVGTCPVPAASNSNPGAEAAPAIGTYTYVSCTDSSDTTDVKIAAGDSKNGVTRREVTEQAGGFSQTATQAYGPNGILQEVLTINYGATPIKCDWNPDVLEFPAQLSVGAKWKADSKCTVAGPNGNTTLHLTADATVSGRVQAVIGGATLNCWVVDAHIVLDTGPNGSVDLTEHDHFDPAHGINVYRHSESKTPQGSVTRVDHLKSITPGK